MSDQSNYVPCQHCTSTTRCNLHGSTNFQLPYDHESQSAEYSRGYSAALAEAERLCEEMENARTGEVLLDAGWASACAALAVRIRALREGTE